MKIVCKNFGGVSNRSFLSSAYRYTYNGMEVDHEVSGHGNSYTTQFRQYDPRLGRWKSLDPLAAKYLWQSPYCSLNNNPVRFIDPEGSEGIEPVYIPGTSNNLAIIVVDSDKITTLNLEEQKRQCGTNNVLLVTDLRDVPTYLASYESKTGQDLSFNTIYIRSHSTSMQIDSHVDYGQGGLRLGDGEWQPGEVVVDQQGNIKAWKDDSYAITSGSINTYDPGKEGMRNELSGALIEIVTYLEEDGDLVFSACGMAYHDDFADALGSRDSEKDVNIYLNKDLTNPSVNLKDGTFYYKVSDEILTNEDNFGWGWTIYTYENGNRASKTQTGQNLKIRHDGSVEKVPTEKSGNKENGGSKSKSGGESKSKSGGASGQGKSKSKSKNKVLEHKKRGGLG